MECILGERGEHRESGACVLNRDGEGKKLQLVGCGREVYEEITTLCVA